MFPGLLQKDRLRLVESVFFFNWHNYCHACHTRFAVSSPSCCVSHDYREKSSTSHPHPLSVWAVKFPHLFSIPFSAWLFRVLVQWQRWAKNSSVKAPQNNKWSLKNYDIMFIIYLTQYFTIWNISVHFVEFCIFANCLSRLRYVSELLEM